MARAMRPRRRSFRISGRSALMRSGAPTKRGEFRQRRRVRDATPATAAAVSAVAPARSASAARHSRGPIASVSLDSPFAATITRRESRAGRFNSQVRDKLAPWPRAVGEGVCAAGAAALLAVALGERAGARAGRGRAARARTSRIRAFHATDPCCGLVLRPGAAGWWTSEGRALRRDQQRRPARRRALAREGPAALPDRRHGRLVRGGEADSRSRRRSSAWPRASSSAADALPASGVEPINFGVSGYSAGQELRMYESKAREYARISYCWAVHTANDVADDSKALDAHAMRPYFELATASSCSTTAFSHG